MKIYILLALLGILFLCYQQDNHIKILEKKNIELQQQLNEQCTYIDLIKELKK